MKKIVMIAMLLLALAALSSCGQRTEVSSISNVIIPEKKVEEQFITEKIIEETIIEEKRV